MYLVVNGYYSLWISDSTIATVLYQDYGSCKTECVSGDWFGEVREVDLGNVKQEPHDVCYVIYHTG